MDCVAESMKKLDENIRSPRLIPETLSLSCQASDRQKTTLGSTKSNPGSVVKSDRADVSYKGRDKDTRLMFTSI